MLFYDVTAGFTVEDTAPDSHKYKYFDQQPADRKSFFAAVRKEVNTLWPQEYHSFGAKKI